MFNCSDKSSNNDSLSLDLDLDLPIGNPLDLLDDLCLIPSPTPQNYIKSEEQKSKTFLKNKHLIKREDISEISNNNNSINNNITIQAISSKINLNHDKKDKQCIQNNEDNENEKHPADLILNEGRKILKIISSTQYCTDNKIQKEEIINKERSFQKDNFSIKLFTKINGWIINRIQNSKNIKLYRPNYNIFTHNTNLIDIYIFLDIQYKNILCMTPKIKETLDKLFIDLKIKNKFKQKKSPLNEKSKEYDDAIKLISLYNDIKENEIIKIDDVNRLIIKILIKEGFKEPNDNNLYKKDKDNIKLLLIKNNKKGTYDYQNKSKKNIIDKEIEELNMTLREVIKAFYQSGNEFTQFSKQVEKIVEKVKIQKNNEYSLLDNTVEYNGFFKMIEEDCGLNNEQKNKIRDFTNYFRNKILNEEELMKYRENLLQKNV